MKIDKAIATDHQSKITEATCYVVHLGFGFSVGLVLVLVWLIFLINTLNSPT